MRNAEGDPELLFFESFMHDNAHDNNLDLVQFLQPVFITEVRIIPLGARVQADFPGGVRLGATNPSKFEIQFLLRDLADRAATTLKPLGTIQYDENNWIHLQCPDNEAPTDLLALIGKYGAVTFAVYGRLANPVREPVAPEPPPEPVIQAQIEIQESDEAKSQEEWNNEAQRSRHKHEKSGYESRTESRKSRHERHHHKRDDDDDDDYPERYRRAERSGRRSATSGHARSKDRSRSSRHRHHTDSDEDDYERVRRKSSRDWSRSPHYHSSSSGRRRRHSKHARSRSKDRKRPRTPLSDYHSPQRPYSPDVMIYEKAEVIDDDDVTEVMHFKLKKSPKANKPEEVAPVHTAPMYGGSLPGEEEFEPIDSDEEMPEDDEAARAAAAEAAMEAAAAEAIERELCALAAQMPPVMEDFNPRTQPLLKYESDMQDAYVKEVIVLEQLLKKLVEQSKCEDVAAYRETDVITYDEREHFVSIIEQLLAQLGYIATGYKHRNGVLNELFSKERGNLQLIATALVIALDFNVAGLNAKPLFRIRHIKSGLRLATELCVSEIFLHFLVTEYGYDIYRSLTELYEREYMAVTTKLQILKVFYSILDTAYGIEYFLAPQPNGYEWLYDKVLTTEDIRTKFCMQALLRKLHLHEALGHVTTYCKQLFKLKHFYDENNEQVVPFIQIEMAFELLIDALSSNAVSYQQPRRFWPLAKMFEIPADPVAIRNFHNTLHSYFKAHTLAASLLVLLSNANQLPPTTYMRSLELLSALLNSNVGLDYLIDDAFEITRLILAVLLNLDRVPGIENIETKKESVNTSDAADAGTYLSTMQQSPESDAARDVARHMAVIEQNFTNNTYPSPMEDETLLLLEQSLVDCVDGYKLALQLAYEVQARYHLDAIVHMQRLDAYDEYLVFKHLHALISQTTGIDGRRSTINVISMSDRMQIFLDLIQREQLQMAQDEEANPGKKCKSAVLLYSLDLIALCVRHCEQLDYLIKYGDALFELWKNRESFESTAAAILLDIQGYLMPLEIKDVFNFRDISNLIDFIRSKVDKVTAFPGELITGLRILRHMVVGKRSSLDFEPIFKIDPEELKYKSVLMKFYSADGVQILMQILQKICDLYAQPYMHCSALVNIHGVFCCQTLLPTLQILRHVLSYIIKCHDNFKDLTAIEPLVNTYYLLYYYLPESLAIADVIAARREIVKALVSYTQPKEVSEESLAKSLWTQMVREVLNTIYLPYTFVPGLQLVAELLPLPLPMPLPLDDPLDQSHKQRLVAERKLWSVHLHPLGTQIAELIQMLAPTSVPQLAELLQRVCMQLSDLGPNMSLLISKALIEVIVSEWQASGSILSAQLARYLEFSARLCAFPPLKISMVSLLPGKPWEILSSILTTKDHTKLIFTAQVTVNNMLRSFLDARNCLVSRNSSEQPLLNLASGLPPKELIPRIADALLVCLFQANFENPVLTNAAQNLHMLYEHDYTFHHVSQLLKQKSSEFQAWMQIVINHNETVGYHPSIESIVLLLHSLIEIAKPDPFTCIPHRTLKLSTSELADIIGYKPNPTNENETETVEGGDNVLEHVRVVLHKYLELVNEEALSDVNHLIQLLAEHEAVVAEESVEEETSSSSLVAPAVTEPPLPQAESIVTQYEARPLFTSFPAHPTEGQFTASYWLEPIESLPDMDEHLHESVPCDLVEYGKECISGDVNLITEVKDILNLAHKQKLSQEQQPAPTCFRAGHVEVEPNSGRPEATVFITPGRGRGFSRGGMAPTRSDLFRSRPPNTSRPPSLHVDDFQALETCGAQPTGPTGYNKIPPILRGRGRGRGGRILTSNIYSPFRHSNSIVEQSSSVGWAPDPNTTGGYRPDGHYHVPNRDLGAPYNTSIPTPSYYSMRGRGRIMRSRPYMH